MTHNVLFLRTVMPTLAASLDHGKVKKPRIEMMPKLVNEGFSAKSTKIMRLERHKESYNTENWTRKRGM